MFQLVKLCCYFNFMGIIMLRNYFKTMRMIMMTMFFI